MVLLPHWIVFIVKKKLLLIVCTHTCKFQCTGQSLVKPSALIGGFACCSVLTLILIAIFHVCLFAFFSCGEVCCWLQPKLLCPTTSNTSTDSAVYSSLHDINVCCAAGLRNESLLRRWKLWCEPIENFGPSKGPKQSWLSVVIVCFSVNWYCMYMWVYCANNY